MLKKVISIILSVATIGTCLIMTSCSSTTEDNLSVSEQIANSSLIYPSKNEDFRYNIYTHYVEISECLSSKNNIVVPDNIQDLPVYKICSNAFQDNTTIESITLSNNIIEIGENAFQGCSNLTTVKLPDNLKILGECAFNNCDNLKSIDIPGSLNTINANTFDDCDRLLYVNINSVDSTVDENGNIVSNNSREICSYAFANCISLKNILIPKDFSTIDDSSFINSSDSLTIFSECESESAVFAATNLLDFQLTTKDEYESINKKLLINTKKTFGESLSGSNLNIKLDSTYVYTTDFSYAIDNQEYTKALQENECVLILCLSIQNSTEKSIDLSRYQYEVSADGYNRNISTFGTLLSSNVEKYKEPLIGNLAANETKTGYIAISLPDNWEECIFSYNDILLENIVFSIKSTDTAITFIEISNSISTTDKENTDTVISKVVSPELEQNAETETTTTVLESPTSNLS